LYKIHEPSKSKQKKFFTAILSPTHREDRYPMR
jgi:hypothetical protein